ncbi:7556_t:CDS:2, partial [Entrophospora sp. SA101]
EQEDNIASQEPEGGLPLPTTPIDTIFDPLKTKLGNDNFDSYVIPQDFLKLINREITNKEDEINQILIKNCGLLLENG